MPVVEQKPETAFQLTPSTGRRCTKGAGTWAEGVWRYDGFEPIRAVHCACVTS